MRRLIAAAIMVLMAGCATPPAQLKSEDMAWSRYTISAPLSVVYAGLQNNARHCGGLIDQYEPKWYPSQDMQTAKIDLYIKGGFGGTSDWVAGVIDLAQLDGKTVTKVGIQKPYSNPVFRKNEWWKPRFSNIAKEIEAGATPSCK